MRYCLPLLLVGLASPLRAADVDFAREVHRTRPNLAIILLSGYSGPLLTQEATAAGIQRIVTKPLELEALAETIAELLAPAPVR